MNKSHSFHSTVRILSVVGLAAVVFLTGCAGQQPITRTATTQKPDRTKSSMYAR